jgi:RNA polymerase sigma-70 factor (ECF subfamily)
MEATGESRRMSTLNSAVVVDYRHLPDEQLVARLAMPDIRAFEALYDRYGTLVYSTALQVIGDSQLAEDTAQEVFLRVWRRPDQYVPHRGRFVTWLLTVARNGAIDQIRARRRQRLHETAGKELGRALPADEGEDLALTAQLADESQRVRRALVSLAPEQRRVIEMAYYGGYSLREIAVILSQPLGTVKTRIRRGMQKLRVALAPDTLKHTPT